MRTMFAVAALATLISLCAAQESGKQQESIGPNLKITILYDNTAATPKYKADWGFACFIEGIEKPILFDAGTKSDILAHNMMTAGVDQDKSGYLVISHIHGDHTGGLPAVIRGKHLKEIFLPQELSSPQDHLLGGTKLKKAIVTSPRAIMPHVYLTGAMGDKIIEQCMIIDTDKGLVLINGCSHPGIVEILKRAQEILQKDIYLVLGGFHLIDHTEAQVKEIIDSFKSIGVRYCGASHCTGEKAIAAFRAAYGERFVELGAGQEVTLGKNGISLKQ